MKKGDRVCELHFKESDMTITLSFPIPGEESPKRDEKTEAWSRTDHSSKILSLVQIAASEENNGAARKK